MNTSPSELEKFLSLLPKTPIMIPILANDKKPDIPSGKSWKDKAFHLSPQQAIERLKQGKNVGIVAFDWLVIVDLDNPEKFTLPIKTLTIMTRNGKLHQFYQNYGDVENSVGKNDLAKCGEVRADFQYVLTAGSYVPSSDSAGTGLYHIIDDSPLAILAKKDLPIDFIPSSESHLINSEAINKPISLRNKFGWSLEDLRARDDKLNILLNNNSSGYPSESEADMATLTKLLFWGFDDGESVSILKQFRFRPKLNRQEYISNTLSHITRTKKIEDSVDVKKWNPRTGYMIDLGEGKVKTGLNGSLDLDSIITELKTSFIFKTPKDVESLHYYKDGIYEPSEQMIKTMLEQNLGSKATIHIVQEIIEHLRWSSFVERDTFNKYSGYIPIENGLLQLETGELKPFTPDIIFTFKMPVKYDKTADCPIFKKWLSEVQTQDNILTLQEFAGYCLLPDFPFHKTMWFIGSGRNGKSTFIKTLEKIIGDENCAHIPIGLLSGERNFVLGHFYGKLLNISSEPTTKNELETQLFKLVTGGDRIQAEIKMKQKTLDYDNYCKLIISGNKIPRVRDDTVAFSERIIVIEWLFTFLEGMNQVQQIEKTWLESEAEISGILNWMIEGLQRLQKNKKFTITSTQKEMMIKFERASDSIAAFIHERFEMNPELFTTREDVFNDYQNYCEYYDAYLCDNRKLFDRLRNTPKIKDTNTKIGGKQVRIFKGFKLKPSLENIYENIDGQEKLDNDTLHTSNTHDIKSVSLENNILKIDNSILGVSGASSVSLCETVTNTQTKEQKEVKTSASSYLSEHCEILRLMRETEPHKVFTTDSVVKALILGGASSSESIQVDLDGLVKMGMLVKSGLNYQLE